MTTGKIKKYVLPYLPYVLMFWFFTKCSEAYRLWPEDNFINRLMGCISSLGSVMKNPFPSFIPIDLFVGLLCAVVVYGIVYIKKKNAKKWRKDVEYGSARWGTAKDIAPYVDSNPDKNIILTATESLMLNGRPKNPKHARNKNVMVVGGSGSGKTRFWLKPNLMQMHSSYCVTDPKGTILIECGKMLQRGIPKTEVKLGTNGKPIKDRHGNPVTEVVRNTNGKIVYQPYEIKVLNTIDFSKSMHYNPFAYIRSEKDILKLVTALIANTKGDGKSGDEFWVKAETLLYCALIGMIYYEAPPEEQNMNSLVEMINAMEVREEDETFKNSIDFLFDELEEESPQHFAVRQYKKYKLAAGNVNSKRLIHQFLMISRLEFFTYERSFTP
jgi:type IV secretion system protein VirD4